MGNDLNRTQAVFRDTNSAKVVEAILQIHFPGSPTIVDLTWGKGAFWGGSDRDVIGIDKAPRFGCQVKADARYIPLQEQSVDVLIFDPPHIYSPGNITGMNLIGDYGSFETLEEAHMVYIDAAQDIMLTAGQGSIIKCTDMVKHGRFVPTHAMVMAGLSPFLGWPADIAILDSGVVRMQPWSQVKHLRHAHSYFLVYKNKERDPRSSLAKL